MKSRLLWAAVVLVATVAFYFATIRPAMQSTPKPVNRREVDRAFKDFKMPEIPPPTLPELVIATPTIAPPPPRPVPIVAPRNDPVPGPLTVPIQDGKTIDFSTGAPVIRMQGKDQEALERGLREIAEATQDITFPPSKKK